MFSAGTFIINFIYQMCAIIIDYFDNLIYSILVLMFVVFLLSDSIWALFTKYIH